MKNEHIIIIFESVIIIVMSFFITKQKNQIRFLKRDINKDTIGGADLFHNITKSQEFYKDFLKEIHPDRFIGNDLLQRKAELLVQEIGENKNSYRDLVKLAQKAKTQGFIFRTRFLEKHKMTI